MSKKIEAPEVKKEKKAMTVNEAREFINDVREKKIKRKKVCKKKNYKKLLEAIELLSKELEITEKLNDMYLDKFNKIYLENQEHAEMLREYHRRSNAELYPEETKEEINVLEDLDDDDELDRDLYEASMREMLQGESGESNDTDSNKDTTEESSNE